MRQVVLKLFSENKLNNLSNVLFQNLFYATGYVETHGLAMSLLYVPRKFIIDLTQEIYDSIL